MNGYSLIVLSQIIRTDSGLDPFRRRLGWLSGYAQ